MKKYIFLALFLGFIIINPEFVNGQVVDSPIVASPQDQYIAALQQVVVLLEKQLEQLVSQLQSISDNQAKIAEKINPVSTIQVIPSQDNADELVPTKMSISLNNPESGFIDGQTVFGGNCSPQNLYVEISDQYGKLMKNLDVHFINPDTHLEEIIPGNITNTTPMLVHYTPQQQSGLVSLSFKVDGLATSTVQLGLKSFLSYITASDGSLINITSEKPKDGKYVMTTTGNWVDPITGICL